MAVQPPQVEGRLPLQQYLIYLSFWTFEATNFEFEGVFVCGSTILLSLSLFFILLYLWLIKIWSILLSFFPFCELVPLDLAWNIYLYLTSKVSFGLLSFYFLKPRLIKKISILFFSKNKFWHFRDSTRESRGWSWRDQDKEWISEKIKIKLLVTRRRSSLVMALS